MLHNRISTIGVLCLALLLAAGALAVHARGNQPAAPVVAMVDMERLFTSSDAPQKLAEKSAEISAQAEQRMKDVFDGAFLAQQEGQEYIRLLAKAMPTPEEQARLKELRALSETRSRRLQELSGKNPLDDMEKKELNELNGRRRNVELVMPRLQEDLQADAASRVEAVRRELYNQIRTVVAQVAKEKGVTQVFSSETLIYSALDLTPQVLPKLKK